MRKTLLTRVLPLYVGLVVIALTALALGLNQRARDEHTRHIIGQLRVSYRVLQEYYRSRVPADAAPDAVADPDAAPDTVADPEAAPSNPLPERLRETTKLDIAVFPGSGAALSDRDVPTRPAVNALLSEVRRTGEVATSSYASAPSVAGNGGTPELNGLDDEVYLAGPITDAEGRRLIVVLRRDLSETTAFPEDIMESTVAAGVFVFLLSGAFLVFIAQRQTEPLKAIQDAANHFAAGRLEHRLRLERPREMADVARTLNSMAAQLSWQLARIRRQRNELEAILSSMVEGVVVLDDELRIKSMNRAAAQLFGVNEHAGIGKSVIQYLRNSNIADFAERTLRSQSPLEENLVIYSREIVHLQLHGTVIHEEEQKPGGVLIVLNNISRLKRLENMRKDFVANVSHELKTPITSILGFVETLSEGAIEDPDSAKRFLKIIGDHTNRLSLIIEDLLSLSRLESFDQDIPRDWCTVEEIVNRTKADCAGLAHSKNVRIVDSYAGQVYAYVNQNLLEQALTNLVDNAVKYSPNDSEVRIDVRNRDGELRLSVGDAGMGIPREELDRIFERFYRVDRARSRRMGGTGLGLAIVKHIALAHGGRINVDSVLGEGSSFTITVPSVVPSEDAHTGA
jgi:two-component system phosphate regulon sensor histidine kinase PhoR